MSAHSGWLAAFFYFFVHLGIFGLLLLSALDSSVLNLPFANDIALIVLSSLHHDRFIWYALASTFGSVAGSFLTYWIGDKGGEAFLQAHISRQRFKQIHDKVSRRGPTLLALPALVPPPFPYTVYVLAAGALEVPRNRFLIALGGMRAVRFFTEAILAVIFGRGIVKWLSTPGFRYLIDVIMALAILGSAYSIFQIIRTTRRHGQSRAGKQDTPAPRTAA